MKKPTHTHLEHPSLPPRPNEHQNEKHHDLLPSQPTTTRSTSKPLKRLSQPVTTLMHKLSPPPLEEESQKAAKVLRKLCYESSSSPTSLPQIPPSVVNSCLALAIFTTTRASGLASFSHGSGVLVARKSKEYGGGWSSPAGVTVNSAGVGVMAGIDVYSCVLVINTASALKKFEGTRVSLGGDVGVVAGSLGGAWRDEVGDAGQGMKGVCSYVHTKKGLYAGIQLDGTVITSRADENARFYSERVSVSQILEGSVGRWTVLHDTLSEIDNFASAASHPLLIPMGERFDEEMRASGGYGTLSGNKKKETVGVFPVIMEFDDRRNQTKGKDGIWRQQAQHGVQSQSQIQPQPQPQPRPKRFSKEEWKRGKIYSGIFETEKKENSVGTLPLNTQQQEQHTSLALRPSQPLMTGALGVSNISSKEDLYGAHERKAIDANKKKEKALGSRVLEQGHVSFVVQKPRPRLGLVVPRETRTPVVVLSKEYVEPESMGGFADLTYRNGFADRKEKKKEIVEDDGDASEWEDERLFYELNSRPDHFDARPAAEHSDVGGTGEWEDERGFYVDVPKGKKDEGEWEDERGFYSIVQLEERVGRKKEKNGKGDGMRSVRSSVYTKGERFA